MKSISELTDFYYENLFPTLQELDKERKHLRYRIILIGGGFTLLRFALSYYLTSSIYRAGLKTKTSWNKHYDRTPFIEAMGEGDIMVAATMGALLGIKLTLVAIFLSALLALPVILLLRNRSAEEQRVPFVPFLALATFIVFV